MRISNITTDRAAEVLCELTPYISNIASDEELLSELKNAIAHDEATTTAELMARGAEKISKIIPLILKKRKADVFGILAALNEKTADEIAGQSFITTMKQIREIVKDKELIDFFKSCVEAESEGSE